MKDSCVEVSKGGERERISLVLLDLKSLIIITSLFLNAIGRDSQSK